jgi:hypothetical protein
MPDALDTLLLVTTCTGEEGRMVERALSALAPNQAIMFGLPDEQPARRDVYRRIGGRAHRVFGAGGYSIVALAQGVGVTRLRGT